jgi:hypothetical protein
MKFLPLLLLFVASSAFGEIYTWTDARGSAHYTNRMDEIPVRYRARAKALNYGAEPQAVAVSPQQAQAAKPVEPPAAQGGGGNSPKQAVTPPPAEPKSTEMRQHRAEQRDRAKQNSRRSPAGGQ